MNKQKIPRMIPLALLTTVTVVLWVFLDIYRYFRKAPPVVVPEEIITPLDPSLDMNILSNIKSRIKIDENSMPQITVAPTPKPIVPTPIPVASPLGTETPIPTTEPTATP